MPLVPPALTESAVALGPWLTAIGWIGNACYFSRFLIQWLASERAGRTVAPRVFWWLSLGGSLCLTIYLIGNGRAVLLYGYVVAFTIYLRNLMIGRGDDDHEPPSMMLMVLLACAAATLLVWAGAVKLEVPPGTGTMWLTVAVVGTVIWSSRFVVQWWMSERRGVSYFPRSFWWISLAGNVLLLSFAVHLRDAVLIAGYAIGPFVQLRNLVLAYRPRASEEQPVESSPA